MPDQVQTPRPGPTPMQKRAQPTTDTAAPGGFLSKLNQHFQGHGTMYLVGIGAATLIVMFFYARNKNQAATQQTSTQGLIDPTTGLPYGQATTATNPGSTMGSQLDADYQQLISGLNANTGLLQQILSDQQAATIPNTPSTPTTPTPFKWPLSFWQRNPVLPQGFQMPGPSGFGNQFTFEGIHYALDPGAGGRLYGVVEAPGQKLSATQINAAQFGTGVGKKELLIAPSSYYH